MEQINTHISITRYDIGSYWVQNKCYYEVLG